MDPFAHVPAPQPGLRATVVIPARDEAAGIARTLEALAAQRDIDGSALAAETFDVLVYANNCSDATAAIAQSAAARVAAPRIFVAQERLAPNVAHIGTARRAAMNAAAARLAAAGNAQAILAATDADTLVAPQWIAWTLREMANADAVTGRILIDAAELRALPGWIRVALADESAYHFAVARLADTLAPQSHDPWPRHWQRSGPSFAVRLDAYERAGGVPPVRTLEDIALYDALVAAGARIRHSMRVRVTTSARSHSRAPGGFGARMHAWLALGDAHGPLLVEHPEVTVARLSGEAVGPPEEQAPCVPAAEAAAVLRQLIARGVNDARATRSKVASIAG